MDSSGNSCLASEFLGFVGPDCRHCKNIRNLLVLQEFLSVARRKDLRRKVKDDIGEIVCSEVEGLFGRKDGMLPVPVHEITGVMRR